MHVQPAQVENRFMYGPPLPEPMHLTPASESCAVLGRCCGGLLQQQVLQSMPEGQPQQLRHCFLLLLGACLAAGVVAPDCG